MTLTISDPSGNATALAGEVAPAPRDSYQHRSAPETPDGPALPVFFDRTGKRLRYFVRGAAALIVIALVLVAVMVPVVLAPVWTAPDNRDIGFPRNFLATNDPEKVPVIGEGDDSIFHRVVRVVWQDDRCPETSNQLRCPHLNLVDPVTNAELRPATDEEMQAIGGSCASFCPAAYAIERYGHPADHQLMLTFDDGPDPAFTPQVLDVLSREQVPATFFVVGEHVVEHPDLFRRIIREGHMAGNHTMTHPRSFDAQSDLRNREELIGNDHVMRATAGYATTLFRIPHGDPEHNALALLQAQQLGYLHVDADLDSRDWAVEPGNDVALPPLDGNGHVVLMHDGGGDRAATVRMLEQFIAQAKQQGYTFTTLAPLLPANHLPTKGVAPGLADEATVLGLDAVIVGPRVLLGFLFWLGIGTLTVMSAVYLTLALVTRRRDKQRPWLDCPTENLPVVSVVLAAYNEEKVIQRTLAALRDQDYPPEKFEVIAVNDGSADRTLQILHSCASWWPHLRIVSQPNSGKSSALNNGVNHARNDATVIVTLDADTLFGPTTLGMLARHFAHNTGGQRVGAVAGHVKVGNRINILTAWQSLEYISGICVTRLAESMMGAIWIVPGACSAWRREALQRMGGFPGDTMAEDADATLMLHRLGYTIRQENEAVGYTEAPESIRDLAKQRKRWTYGNIQALWKHRVMVLRPKYGLLGMVSLPYALLSLLVPLVFLPLAVYSATASLAEGNWRSIALFAAFVALVHLIISVTAIAIARERWWHLLVVPIYRLIYEPLRAYLLVASAYRVIRGTAVQWDKLERRNSVRAAGEAAAGVGAPPREREVPPPACGGRSVGEQDVPADPRTHELVGSAAG
jgi:biofilm PGA synthesis N-glycosyltransferase PgaC